MNAFGGPAAALLFPTTTRDVRRISTTIPNFGLPTVSTRTATASSQRDESTSLSRPFVNCGFFCPQRSTTISARTATMVTSQSSTTRATTASSASSISLSTSSVTQSSQSTGVTAGATSSNSNSSHSGLSGGAIAAAVVVPIIFVIAAGLLVFFLLRRRKQRKNASVEDDVRGFDGMTMREAKGPIITSDDRDNGSFTTGTTAMNSNPALSNVALPAGALKRKGMGAPALSIDPNAAPYLPTDMVEPVSPILDSAETDPFDEPAHPVTTPAPAVKARPEDESPRFTRSTNSAESRNQDELFIDEQPAGRHWHSVNGSSPIQPQRGRFRVGSQAPRSTTTHDDVDDDDLSELDDDDDEAQIFEAAPVQRHRASVIDMPIPSPSPSKGLNLTK